MVRIGGFTKASYELYISQSSLSQHIKKLENDLGVSLMNRTTRKLTLTQEGKCFLRYAEQIVKLQEQYEHELSLMRSEKECVIKIGSMPMFEVYGISQVLKRFSKMHPEYIISISEGRTEIQKTALRKYEYDFIIMRDFGEQSEKDLNRFVFLQDYLTVIVPKEHPLAQKTGARIEEFRNDSFLMGSAASPFYSRCIELAGNAGCPLRITNYLSRFESIVDMVSKGFGCSFATEEMLGEKMKDVASVQIEPTVPVYIEIYWNKLNRMNSGARLLLNYFFEEIHSE